MKSAVGTNQLLVENPLTGNGSFAAALKLSPIPEIPKWATPKEYRKSVELLLGVSWDSLDKMILIRDPQSRFLSGAALALSGNEDSRHGASESMLVDLEHLAGETEAEPRERVLALLLVLGQYDYTKWPTYLRPQRLWLSSYVDTAIATTDIAEFFNQDGRVSCLRSNLLTQNPAFPKVSLRNPRAVELVHQLYAVDYDIIPKVILWSPSPNKVRTLSGYCRTCPSPLKLSALPELHDSANEEPTEEQPIVATPRKRRKRRP